MTRRPERLVVYELAGELGEGHEPELGENFLGFQVEAGYSFLFFAQEAGAEIDALLGRDSGLRLSNTHRMKYSDWQDGAGFTAFDVGPLTIAPAWEAERFAGCGSCLFIDPGLSFGFGGHPTTRACLEFLVRIYAQDRPRSVLDLGAGTGILGLAALKLGADQALGVEYSHEAWATARRNAVLNGLGDRFELTRGLAQDHALEPAEILVSNLHLPVQEELIARGALNGRNWLVLSGLFHEQGRKIEQTVTGRGFQLVDRVRETRWVSLLLRRRV